MIEIDVTRSRDIKIQDKNVNERQNFCLTWECDRYANNECLRNKWLGSDNNLPATSTLLARAPTDYDHRTTAKLKTTEFTITPPSSWTNLRTPFGESLIWDAHNVNFDDLNFIATGFSLRPSCFFFLLFDWI